MGKKVLKRKKTEFILEPDGFSIHTFALSYQMTATAFQKMLDNAYALKLMYQEKDCENVFVCNRYANHGIRLSMQRTTTDAGHPHYFLRIVVNPRKLIDPKSSYLGILPPEKQSLERLDKAFRKLFKDSPFPHDISQYYLSRVDLCANIRCGNKRVFREMVRVLRKAHTPDKYERKKYQHSDKKKANRYNKHYIRLSCGTHELVIYDKTYQLTENNLVVDYETLPEGILRFEVQYQREKLRHVEKKLGLDGSTNDPLKVLWHLMQHSRELLCKQFKACYSKTPFFPLEQIEAAVKASRYTAKTKQSMLELARQMQRKQTVDKALRDMKLPDDQAYALLERFEKLGANPVPLRKGFCCKRLPSPIELLETVDNQLLTVEMEYWKTK